MVSCTVVKCKTIGLVSAMSLVLLALEETVTVYSVRNARFAFGVQVAVWSLSVQTQVQAMLGVLEKALSTLVWFMVLEKCKTILLAMGTSMALLIGALLVSVGAAGTLENCSVVAPDKPLPEVSFPSITIMYAVWFCKVGVTKLTTVFPALQVAVPRVKLLLEVVTVAMFMASENVSCTWVFTAMLLEFLAGTLVSNRGEVMSMKMGVALTTVVLDEMLPALSTACTAKS